MWAQLAIAGAKGLMDEQNRKRDIESNIITQKYAPLTGQRADFGSISKNEFGNTMLKGLGAGLMDQKELAAAEAAKSPSVDQAGGTTGYSADYLAMPERKAGANRSSFATITPKAPARAPAVQAPMDFASMFGKQEEVPLMLQGQNPQQENMWLKMLSGAR